MSHGERRIPQTPHSVDYSLKCHVEMNTMLMFSYLRVDYLLSLQKVRFYFFIFLEGLGKPVD